MLEPLPDPRAIWATRFDADWPKSVPEGNRENVPVIYLSDEPVDPECDVR